MTTIVKSPLKRSLIYKQGLYLSIKSQGNYKGNGNDKDFISRQVRHLLYPHCSSQHEHPNIYQKTLEGIGHRKLPRTFTGSENTGLLLKCGAQAWPPPNILQNSNPIWCSSPLNHPWNLRCHFQKSHSNTNPRTTSNQRGRFLASGHFVPEEAVIDVRRKRRVIFTLCSWEYELCFNVGKKTSKEKTFAVDIK